MEREQFTFYRSFWEALKALPKKDQLPFITAVCAYALDGESRPLSGSPYAAFLLIRPVLDKANKKASNGKHGGSKPKANEEQIASKREANKEQTASHIEGEREEEREVERDLYPPTPFQGAKKQAWTPPTFDAVLEVAKMRGIPELARAFYDYYAAAGWRDSDGKPVYSWQQKLVAWKVREDDKLRKQVSSQGKQGQNGNVFAEMLRKEGGLA